MTRLAALLLVTLALAGCANGHEVGPVDGFRYYHDDVHGVGCWTNYDRAIACIPDSQYTVTK